MSFLGIILTALAAIGNTFRYSFVKDLSKHRVSNESVNLFYRLTSLPFVLAISLLFKTNIFNVGEGFFLWFSGTLFVNIFFSLYVVYLYQKHDFSSVEGLAFMDILFTTVAGMIFFKEILAGRQLLGISIVVAAFVFLTISELQHKKISINYFEIIFYYMFGAILNIFNKQSVLLSSPFTFAVYLTLGLIVSNFIIIKIKKEKVYNWQDNSANKLLILVGLTAAISFILNNFGYKLLPVGIVATIYSLKTFFSLWLSTKKYGEINILPKVVAAIISFIGIVIVFT